MKNVLLLVGVLAGASVFAAPTPQVVTGRCKLESTGEVLKLRNVDPLMHYGMFATTDTPGHRIYLTINHGNHIAIYTQSPDGGGSYALIPKSPVGEVTQVRVGKAVKNEKQPGLNQWLSCNLDVVEK